MLEVERELGAELVNFWVEISSEAEVDVQSTLSQSSVSMSPKLGSQLAPKYIRNRVAGPQVDVHELQAVQGPPHSHG